MDPKTPTSQHLTGNKESPFPGKSATSSPLPTVLIKHEREDEGKLIHVTDQHRPRGSDARRAAEPPAAEFQAKFREALLNSERYCTRPDYCQFFADDRFDPASSNSNSDLDSSLADRPPSDVQFPLLLFADFPSLPDNDTLSDLLYAFHHVFVPSMPFMSAMALPETGAPPYLVMPMALVGAAVSANIDHRVWTDTLWRASNSLLVGVLEMDNSISRKIHWVQAALIFIAYGVLQNDPVIWHKTHACSGILDTHSTISSYLLIDTLRAVHMQIPPAMTVGELSISLGNGHGFRALYQNLTAGHSQPHDDLSPDDYLFLLLALLSDIVTLNRIAPSLGLQTLDVWEARTVGDAQFSAQAAGVVSEPLAPLSAKSEYFRMRQLLRKALSRWSAWANVSSQEKTKPCRVAKSSVVLLHFCEMMLEVGPMVDAILSNVGYIISISELQDAPTAISTETEGFRFSAKSISSAWQVLETVDCGEETTGDADPTSQRTMTPVWFPIVVFYSAIVVWSGMLNNHNTERPGARIKMAKGKVLGVFQNEFRQMKPSWGCLDKMTATLDNLKWRH